MSDVVQKLWGFCHTLRHDGIDYADYVEQITFLLFLKMADEKGVALPAGLLIVEGNGSIGQIGWWVSIVANPDFPWDFEGRPAQKPREFGTWQHC
jgi:hypothetical protein